MSNLTGYPTSGKPSKIVLLVHHDLGFVMWLSQMIVERGHVAIPSTKAQEALRLIEELPISTIDLLVANPASPGTADLVSTLQGRQRTLQVVAIGDPDAVGTARADVGADASLSESLMIVLRALDQEKAGGAG